MKKIFYFLLAVSTILVVSCGNNVTEDTKKNNSVSNPTINPDNENNTGSVVDMDDDDSFDPGYKALGDEDIDLRVCLKWARAEVLKTNGDLAYAKIYGIVRTEKTFLSKGVTIEYNTGDGVWKSFDAMDHGLTSDKKFNKFFFSLPKSERFKLSDGMGLVFEFKIKYTVGKEEMYAKNGYIFKANAMPTPNNPVYTQTVLGYAHVLVENAKIEPVYQNQVLSYFKFTSHVITKVEPNYPTKAVTMYYLKDNQDWKWAFMYNYNPKQFTYTGYKYPYSNGYKYGLEDWYLETNFPIDTPGIQFSFSDKLYKANGFAGPVYLDKNRCLRYWMKMPTSNQPVFLSYNTHP